MKKNFLPFLPVLCLIAVASTGCRTLFANRNAEPASPSGTDTTISPSNVVLTIDQVGTPGTYPEFVLPPSGKPTATSFAVETEGLQGSSGSHVSLPPPVRDPEVAKPAKKVVAPAGGTVYTVKNGDILGRIARAHGVTVSAIVRANDLKNPNKIRVGQKLAIPAPSASAKPAAKASKGAASVKKLAPRAGYSIYTVKNGDILGRIAIANKTTQKAIIQANSLANPDKLRVGQQLYIPQSGAAAAAASTPATPPAPTPAATLVAPVRAPAAPPPPAAPAAPAAAAPASQPADVDFLSGFDL